MRIVDKTIERKNAFTIESARLSLFQVKRAAHLLENETTRIESAWSDEITFETVTDLLERCWTIIDNIDRARELLLHIKGLKRKTPEVQRFLRGTAEVEVFRNIFQHLATEIPSLPVKTQPSLGAFSWISKEKSVALTVTVTGTEARGDFYGLAYNTVNREFVCRYQFSFANKDLDVAKVVSECDLFSSFLEEWLDRNDMLTEQPIRPSKLRFVVKQDIGTTDQ